MLTTTRLVCGVRQMSTWQIFGSALVERKAAIVEKFDVFEKAYHDLLQLTEVEGSLLSDFELRAREEKKIREEAKTGATKVKLRYTEDEVADWEKAAAIVREKLHQKTVTDPKSLKRCLDKPITLLVKQKIKNNSFWMFPQAAHQGEETLRETAERALVETVGDKLQFITLGNAPIAYYHYKYPQDVQQSTGFEGAKLFYFKIQYAEGDVQLNNNKGEDYMWANYEELMSYLPKQIKQAVKPAIFEPPSIDFTSYLEDENEFKELARLTSKIE